jgi:hypothetical protein
MAMLRVSLTAAGAGSKAKEKPGKLQVLRVKGINFCAYGVMGVSLALRRMTQFALLMVYALVIGCRHDPTVWRTSLRSPDGAWLATARTDQNGGFGSAWIETVVTLQKLDNTVNRGKPFDVLSYPEGGPIRKPYVLSDENAGGGVNLQMKWLTPEHLEIDYTGNIDPDLQVVRFSDIDITLYRQVAKP